MKHLSDHVDGIPSFTQKAPFDGVLGLALPILAEAVTSPSSTSCAMLFLKICEMMWETLDGLDVRWVVGELSKKAYLWFGKLQKLVGA